MGRFLRANLLSSAAICVCLSLPVSADILSGLKNQATEKLTGGSAAGATGLGSVGSALGLPSIGGEATGNIAGVLQYCVKNKLSSMTDTDKVKDQLLSKLGMESPVEQQKDSGYQQGVAGILSGKDGASFDLSRVKGDLQEKACDYVLENASALL